MLKRSPDREAIEAEIERIRSLGLEGLRTLWRTTFRPPPPTGFTRDLVARFICWHVQEQAFGGLDPKPPRSWTATPRATSLQPRRGHKGGNQCHPKVEVVYSFCQVGKL
jgi:hypothetical protein